MARLLVAVTVVMTAVLVSGMRVTGGDGQDREALMALKRSLRDPNKVLRSWDGNLENVCTWFRVSCDDDYRVHRIDLAKSGLSGTLVPQLGNLKRLQYLELQMNHLQGNIPSELGELTELISLDLFDNSLSGRIPPTLGNLRKIQYMRLGNNRLSGQIPRELRGLLHLQVFNVSHNNLCGPIPWGANNLPYDFNNNPRINMHC